MRRENYNNEVKKVTEIVDLVGKYIDVVVQKSSKRNYKNSGEIL